MNERTSVALGTFDGLHIGHIAVLKSALSAAADDSCMPLALLFDTHPQFVLRGNAPHLLQENAARDRMLLDMGFALHTVSFADICDLEPEAFVHDILVHTLHVAVVSCGFNYRFGRNGKGDAKLLRSLCDQYEMTLHVCEPVLYDGQPVSSTRIRQALSNGDLFAVNAMLGRPFSFSGKVCHGNAVGRELSYPTANQAYPASMAVPAYGVYATDAQIGSQTYRAITNIGIRPTVDDHALCSETHILGLDDADLYGQTMTVYLQRFIRPERKFSCVEDVFRQVRQDIQAAYPDYDGIESEDRYD